MESNNFERLMRLAEEVFDIGNDPAQLYVDQDALTRLVQIHPATISECDEGDGPVAWLLVIPTTIELMNEFLGGRITEQELFNLTPVGIEYEAIYICSALVLEEYRRKGITKKLALDAIEKIRQNHPIKVLFCWSFNREGDLTADTISWLAGLPLRKKSGRK